jgi:hypothetical protein
MFTSHLLKIAGSSFLLIAIVAASVLSLQSAIEKRYRLQSIEWTGEKTVLQSRLDSIDFDLQSTTKNLSSVLESMSGLGEAALGMVEVSLSAEDRAMLDIELEKAFRRILESYGIDPYLAPADSLKKEVLITLGDFRLATRTFGIIRIELEEEIQKIAEDRDTGINRVEREKSSGSAMAKTIAELKVRDEAAKEKISQLEEALSECANGDDCTGARLQTAKAAKKEIYTKLTQIMHQLRTTTKRGPRRSHRELEFERLNDIRVFIDELAVEIGIEARKK